MRLNAGDGQIYFECGGRSAFVVLLNVCIYFFVYMKILCICIIFYCAVHCTFCVIGDDEVMRGTDKCES